MSTSRQQRRRPRRLGHLPRTAAALETLESRVHLSVARPAYNTGTGFFVVNGNVYDANGNAFVMKGPNNNHAWGSYTDNYNAIDHIARTGANAARAVMYQDIAADPTHNWTDAADTPARRKQVVERYLANGVVPIVEDHASIQDSASQSNPAALHEITTHWLDNSAWLKQYERYVILNIANEWGPVANASGSNTVWRDNYITQVNRLRAGSDGNLATTADNINALIMIDAGGWGQDLNTLRLHAQQVLDADPQHNIVFSIHLYGQWRDDSRPWEVSGGETDYGPWDIGSRLAALKSAGLPLVVGEWAWEDFRDFSNLGAPYAAYRTRRVMEICGNLGIGWLGWSYNHSGPATLNMIAGAIQNYQYNSNTDLTDWGNWIVNEPSFGTKAGAVRASVFPAIGLPNPAAPLTPLPAAPPSDMWLVLENANVNVPEGGAGLARVKLAKQPAGNVTVSLAKISGGTNDTNLNLATASLTFTTANWSQYQAIPVSATADGDATSGTAKFRLAAAGIVPTDFLAKEVEPPTAAATIVNPDRDRLYNGSGTATSVSVTSTYPPVGAPNGTFFLRFNLAALTGEIAAATLRVFTTNTTASRYVRVFAALDDTWTESATTGINASYPIHANPLPAGGGFLLPTSGGSYVDISFRELTDYVRAQHWKDGVVSLALRMVSGTATFHTDEGTNRPQLILNTVAPIPVADIVDVSPDPRDSSLNSIALSFSEPVTGLGLDDLLLTRDGAAVPLSEATVSSSDGGTTWTLGNLTELTGKVGTYELTLNASGSGIADSNGFALVAGATDTWQMNAINDSTGPNEIRLVRNGTMTDYFLDGAFQYSFNASLLASLRIAPGADDDAISLDFANGTPLPPSTTIDGGDAFDTLHVYGSTVADNVVFDAGSVAFNGAAISHVAMEAVTFDGRAGGDSLAVHGGSLTLTASQRLVALSIDITDARLDARDHDLLLDYDGGSTSPLGSFDGTTYSGVLGLIAAGYTFGEWSGYGLVTTMPDAQRGVTTLAPASAADVYSLGPGDTALHDGHTVDATTVIVKYTYAGDMNLDGLVDGADYGVIDNYVQFPGTDAYANGDLNYDGIIDGADYGLIDNSIQLQGPPL